MEECVPYPLNETPYIHTIHTTFAQIEFYSLQQILQITFSTSLQTIFKHAMPPEADPLSSR